MDRIGKVKTTFKGKKKNAFPTCHISQRLHSRGCPSLSCSFRRSQWTCRSCQRSNEWWSDPPNSPSEIKQMKLYRDAHLGKSMKKLNQSFKSALKQKVKGCLMTFDDFCMVRAGGVQRCHFADFADFAVLRGGLCNSNKFCQMFVKCNSEWLQLAPSVVPRLCDIRFIKGSLFVQAMSVLLAAILRQMSNLSQVSTDFPLVMSRCSVFCSVLQTCFVPISLRAKSCDFL